MPKGGYPTSLVRGADSRLRSQPLPRFYSHPFYLVGSESLYYSRFLLSKARLGCSYSMMAIGEERNWRR